MKSDPHKQKKNAAYKKKHGIATTDAKAPPKGKGEQQVGEVTSSRDESRTRQLILQGGNEGTVGKRGVNQVGGASTQPGTEVGPIARDTGCKQPTADTSLQQQSEPVRSFQRRKVVTNWAKYELRDEESEQQVQLRGADFAEILKSSGRTLGEYQFKNALVLDKDGGPPTAAVVGDVAARFLSIDCARLADSLAGIPLHTRLRLSGALFESTQLAEFESEAVKHAAAYRESLLAAEGERGGGPGQREPFAPSQQLQHQQQQQQQLAPAARAEDTLDDDFNDILNTLDPVQKEPLEKHGFLARESAQSTKALVDGNQSMMKNNEDNIVDICGHSTEIANATTTSAGLGSRLDVTSESSYGKSVVSEKASDCRAASDATTSVKVEISDSRISAADESQASSGSKASATVGVTGFKAVPMDGKSNPGPATGVVKDRSSVAEKSLSELEADLDSLLGL